MRATRLLLVALTVLAGASSLTAQGAISVQGFGYPPGQLGAGSLGLGGSTGEMDPGSALNPASVGVSSRYSIYAHFQPEFRRTTVAGATDGTTALRFPNFLATGGFGRVTIGVSFSTLLDRTWANFYQDTQVVGGDSVPSRLNAASDGGINDSRLAVAYVVNPKLQLGLGIHAISGENRIEFGRTFPDSLGIGAVVQRTIMSYGGRALSLGVLTQPTPAFLVAASMRFAGRIDLEQTGATIADADLPMRFGAGVSYLGIPNTTLAFRIERTTWSDLEPLGTAATSVFDATEFSLGAESVGPKLGGAFTMLRLGYRDRTLPFGVAGEQVSERIFSGGFSVPMARGRSQIDAAVQRAARSGGGATEKAWLLSLGLGIRP